MNLRITLIRALLCVGWLLLLVVSVEAVSRMGVSPASTVFIGDFLHPWRAQFNTDFMLHLFVIAAWMFYRSRTWWGGVICAIVEINFGALFLLAYLLAVSINAKGDGRRILLGSHA
jgi:hypothetical protein